MLVVIEGKVGVVVVVGCGISRRRRGGGGGR